MKNKEQLLWQAIDEGSEQEVREALAAGADPLAFNQLGDNAIFLALHAQDVSQEIIELLLNHVTKPENKKELRGGYKLNPDSIAIVIELYLRAFSIGQDVIAVSIIEKFMVYVNVGREFSQNRSAIKANGSIYKKLFSEISQETSLHRAAQNSDHDALMNEINRSFDVNIRTIFDDTPLILAVKANQTANVESLLVHLASVDAVNIEGNTALHYAVENNNVDFINLLTTFDNVINIANNVGNTALHLAALAKDLDLMLRLIEKGADFSINNNNGETPLELAFGKSNAKLASEKLKNLSISLNSERYIIKIALELMIEQEPDPHETLCKAIKKGCFYKVKYAVEVLNASILRENKNGDNALYLALHSPNPSRSIIQYLLTHSDNNEGKWCTKTNKPKHVRYDRVFLERALKIKRADILALLVTHGADEAITKSMLNQSSFHDKDRYEHPNTQTYLMSIIEDEELSSQHKICLIRILAECGADLNAEDTCPVPYAKLNGSHTTAAHFAALEGDVEIMKVLHFHGADIMRPALKLDSSINEFYNVLDLAASAGKEKMLAYLVDDYYPRVANTTIGFEDYIHFALHWAAYLNHLDSVKFLLEKGAEVNKPDSHGCTPLHYAALRNHFSIIEFLVNKKANLNLGTIEGVTAFYCALQNSAQDNGRTAFFLYDNGASCCQENTTNQQVSQLFITNEQGETLAHIAVKENRDDIIERLSSQGLFSFTDELFTKKIIQYAAKNNYISVIDLLIKFEFNIKNLDRDHGVVILAIENNSFNFLKCLIENGCEFSNREALHRAIDLDRQQFVELILSSKTKKENGLIINDYKEKITLLHIAAEKGNPGIISLLLDNKAQIDAKTSKGNTPLICAVLGKHFDAITVLIDRSANINCHNRKKITPLIIALEGKEEKIIALLINRGADIMGDDGEMAWKTSLFEGFLTIVEILLQKREGLLDLKIDYQIHYKIHGEYQVVEAPFPPLAIAVHKKNLALVDFLLRAGAKPNIESPHNLTSLNLAVYFNLDKIAEHLLKHGASPNQGSWTAFHAVIDYLIYSYGKTFCFVMAELLLQYGADINARDSNGGTVLHHVINRGSQEQKKEQYLLIIKFLYTHCIDENIRNKEGKTAKDCSRHYKLLERTSKYREFMMDLPGIKTALIDTYGPPPEVPLPPMKGYNIVKIPHPSEAGMFCFKYVRPLEENPQVSERPEPEPKRQRLN